jgi:diguanylate cyclase (GGDEF)-like protein
MRNDERVERGRYRDSAVGGGNRNRPRDGSSASLALSRIQVDANFEVDRPPPPHRAHPGEGTKRVVPLPSPRQPGESKPRRRGAFMVHAVLVIDLNGFKAVNDALGHQVGDDVFRAVGDRLRGAVRQGDTVARFGADQFAILFEDVIGEESARVLVEHIPSAIRRPIRMAEREIVPEASIGVAVTGQRPYSAQDLLRFADSAMREAKQRRPSNSVDREDLRRYLSVDGAVFEARRHSGTPA